MQRSYSVCIVPHSAFVIYAVNVVTTSLYKLDDQDTDEFVEAQKHLGDYFSTIFTPVARNALPTVKDRMEYIAFSNVARVFSKDAEWVANDNASSLKQGTFTVYFIHRPLRQHAELGLMYKQSAIIPPPYNKGS